MAVQKIQAKKTVRQQHISESPVKLKVAAYCRVSTDSLEQESSYEAQCVHYIEYIKNNPRWELAGIYADEGISGTSTKHRDQFNQMIRDCETGKINMIITKSISRFARNTLDCLQYIRKLKELGIAIYFEKEAINTLDAKGEVLITIMASIAQQESQSISQNVRMGIQYKMQQGKGNLNTKSLMGFDRGEEPDMLVIILEEAQIVRRIFREYLDGYSPAMICRHLEADHIPTPSGKMIWYPTTVTSMLENEKYAGDLLLQKYYTVDFLTHKIARNTGQLPQYLVEEHHAPIVPKSVYYQVQGELMRRSSLKNDPAKLRYGSADALFGRVICGRCGRVMKRYRKPDGNTADWRCRKRAYTKKSNTREMKGLCDCRYLSETEAKEAIIEALNRLPAHKGQLLRLQAQIRNEKLKPIDALKTQSKKQEGQLEERRQQLKNRQSPEVEEEILSLEHQIHALQQERNNLILERAEYANREMHIRLLLELVEIMDDTGENGVAIERAEKNAACYDYEDFFCRTRYKIPEGILSRTGHIIMFDDAMVIRFLDTVTVCDDGCEINFKGGIQMKMYR